VPGMASQDRVSGIQKFKDALYQGKLSTPFRLPYAIIESLQYPMFHVWIPQMKVNAFAKDVAKAMQLDPSLINDQKLRVQALRKIASSVDNRFGEMNYDSMFWNKYVKDIAILNTLSVGWQTGLIREFGGGGAQVVKTVFDKRQLNEIAKTGDLDKAFYSASYMAMTMAIGGLITYLYTKEKPEGLDYFYPRDGGTGPDGRPTRISTPFTTRDFAAISKHIQNEGTVEGLSHLVTNKASGVIGLTGALLNNVNSMDEEIRNPDAPFFQRRAQDLAYIFRDVQPISAEAIRRSESKSQATMGTFGFGPAPKYIQASPLEGEIKSTYLKYNPKLTPFEKAEQSRDARELRRAAERDDPKYGDLLDKMIDKYELSRDETKRLEKSVLTQSDPSIGMFARLDWRQQHRILDKHWKEMTEDERADYVAKVNKDHPYEEPQ